jgi:hypothetical protein
MFLWNVGIYLYVHSITTQKTNVNIFPQWEPQISQREKWFGELLNYQVARSFMWVYIIKKCTDFIGVLIMVLWVVSTV